MDFCCAIHGSSSSWRSQGSITAILGPGLRHVSSNDPRTEHPRPSESHSAYYMYSSMKSVFLSAAVLLDLAVRHSSATIPLRVSLFLLEIPSAAARTSFS